MLRFTNMEEAGLIPEFLSESDLRGAVDQINERYAHGGGWLDFSGFLVEQVGARFQLRYPGSPEDGEPDEVYAEVSRARLRNELIVLFQSAWLMVRQPDGTHRIARID